MLVNEITIKKLSYDGNDLEQDLADEMGSSDGPERIQVDVYIDKADVREPYPIWGPLNFLKPSEPWEIGRTWPFGSDVDLELWAGPADPNPKYGYTDTHTQIDSISIVSMGPNQTKFDAVDITVDFEISQGPDAQYESVKNPSGVEVETLVRTKKLQSAYKNFESAISNDVAAPEFLDGQKYLDVVDLLTKRTDLDGIQNQPDGYPDPLIAAHDQAPFGYCAVASIMVNWGVYQPRRLLEFCRALYQSFGKAKDGDERYYGVNAYSVFIMLTESKLEEWYPDEAVSESTIGQYEYDLETAKIVTFLHTTFRNLLSKFPDVSNAGKLTNTGGGLQPEGTQDLMSELAGWPNVQISQRRDDIGRNGRWALNDAKPLNVADEMVVLDLYGDVLRTEAGNFDDLDESSPNHSVALLKLDDDPEGETRIVYQNTWGGGVREQTVPESVVKEHFWALNYTEGHS